jgi:hypothetical protein
MHAPAAVSKHRTLQPFEGARPQLGRDNFVAPNSSLIGNVKLGDQSSVFYGAVIRGRAMTSVLPLHLSLSIVLSTNYLQLLQAELRTACCRDQMKRLCMLHLQGMSIASQ